MIARERLVDAIEEGKNYTVTFSYEKDVKNGSAMFKAVEHSTKKDYVFFATKYDTDFQFKDTRTAVVQLKLSASGYPNIKVVEFKNTEEVKTPAPATTHATTNERKLNSQPQSQSMTNPTTTPSVPSHDKQFETANDVMNLASFVISNLSPFKNELGENFASTVNTILIYCLNNKITYAQSSESF